MKHHPAFRFFLQNYHFLVTIKMTTDQVKIEEFCAKYGSNANDVKAVNENGESLLHQMSILESLADVESLVAKGADVNAKNIFGTTPLHRAVAKKENIEVVKYLVSKGADVGAKDKDGRAPIHVATYFENIEIAEFLLAQGADINVKNKLAKTPLHGMAYGRGNVEVAQMLVSKGADVHAKTHEGKTPFDIAEEIGNTELAEFLSGIR